MGVGRHGQLFDVAVGEFDQAIGVVCQPQVFLVAPAALTRQEVAQQRVERSLRSRRRRDHLGHNGRPLVNQLRRWDWGESRLSCRRKALVILDVIAEMDQRQKHHQMVPYHPQQFPFLLIQPNDPTAHSVVAAKRSVQACSFFKSVRIRAAMASRWSAGSFCISENTC